MIKLFFCMLFLVVSNSIIACAMPIQSEEINSQIKILEGSSGEYAFVFPDKLNSKLFSEAYLTVKNLSEENSLIEVMVKPIKNPDDKDGKLYVPINSSGAKNLEIKIAIWWGGICPTIGVKNMEIEVV